MAAAGTGAGAHLTAPFTLDATLEWARENAAWYFRSYYKYSFTFAAHLLVAFPGDPHDVHHALALVTAGGDPDGIYKLRVEDRVYWDDFWWLGHCHLVIRDSDGTELITVDYAGPDG